MKNKIINCIFVLFFIIAVIFSFYNVYLIKTISVFVLIIDIYMLLKYKKNKFLFTIFLCMAYFDYSVVISKYLFTTKGFDMIYNQITYEDTMFIGIITLYLFHLIVLLILDFNKTRIIRLRKEKTTEIKNESDNSNNIVRKTLEYIILIALIVIIFDNNFFHILGINDRIMEYSNILFIFSFYYFKDKKCIKWILFVLMIISAFAILKMGSRISIIQILLSYFFIYYESKMNTKRILIGFCTGILVFSIAGIYGNYLDKDMSYTEALKNVTFSDFIESFSEEKMALDTSYSAYWTGLTFIETSNKVSTHDRIENALGYFFVYTLIGQNSSYVPLTTISRNYYLHYWGGYINGFFYYWFGWIGIIIIGIIVGKFLKIIANGENKKSDFYKLFYIYILSTLPRWYMYNPTPLFRGLLIFILLYFVLYKISIKSKYN